MPAYYPIFVDIRGRNCLVFGGDHEGERKVEYLRDCGGQVTLFAEQASAHLEELANQGRIRWIKRRYQPGDLEDAWIVIVADTSDPEANEAIAREARERNVLLNVMDVTPLCTFIAPAVINREDVTVAVSTAGTSPALARRLRERLSDHEYCQCLRWADMGPILADIRADIRARNLPVTPDEWQECMTEDILDLFESGEREQARRKLFKALEEKAASKSRDSVKG